MVDLLFR